MRAASPPPTDQCVHFIQLMFPELLLRAMPRGPLSLGADGSPAHLGSVTSYAEATHEQETLLVMYALFL